MAKTEVFLVHDSIGRKTLVIKPSERAVRMSWARLQADRATFGMPPVDIVKITKAFG